MGGAGRGEGGRKSLKSGSKLGQRADALKRGAGTPSQTKEVYLEPCKASMIKLFCENNQQGLAFYSDLLTLRSHKHEHINKIP